MIVHSTMTRTFQQTPIVRGRGLISNVIENLPFEAHIPGYNFCGPSTKLQKRLQRGDVGINPLDEFCKQHDIFYSQQKDLTARQQADKLLADQAIQRAFASDSSFGERMAALGVAGAMKAKKKMGFGLRKHRTQQRKKRLNKMGKGLRKKSPKSQSSKRRLRILPLPKTGGFLPLLLPILGALGALGGGAASIAKAVNDAKANQSQLAEQKRHNLALEASRKVSPTGKGFFLAPYKKNC
ncbi:unnamed protein product [Acanthoscelides obtectus]|uniref:Phospholipase A2-like domain-containing protein n=2 Tax=Acanthoscelides obtectus TaxID=200917 RepID=A0A9P0KSS0_ACAOB|nr:unnamed protein product [Acanthoscelides obtectus]CAK1641192.1 hypothetical protein AOBTE_LOCUS12225 [Acanthoscelides obtectus]